MNDRRILWQLADGSLCVTVPADPRLSLDDVAQRTRAAHPGLRAALRLPDCAAAELPPRRWRACWRHDGAGRVYVELGLARGQRLAELRAERDRRLAASDAAMWRVQEAGTTAQAEALRVYRQALRDLPNALERSGALEALGDADALDAFTPAWPVPPGGADDGAGPP